VEVRPIRRMVVAYHIGTRGEATSKGDVVVAAADVEKIKIEGAERALVRNPMIEGVVTRRVIWAVESISMFTLSLVDLPN
jgi:hypothetical protein